MCSNAPCKANGNRANVCVKQCKPILSRAEVRRMAYRTENIIGRLWSARRYSAQNRNVCGAGWGHAKSTNTHKHSSKVRPKALCVWLNNVPTHNTRQGVGKGGRAQGRQGR